MSIDFAVGLSPRTAALTLSADKKTKEKVGKPVLKELLVRVLQGAEYKRNPENATELRIKDVSMVRSRKFSLGTTQRRTWLWRIAFSTFRVASSAKTSTLNMHRADTNAKELPHLLSLNPSSMGAPFFSIRQES